jgi:signal transduction histidine kinase
LARKILMGIAAIFLVLVFLVGNWIVNSIQEAVLIKNSEFAAFYMNSFLEPNIQSLEQGDRLSAQDYASMELVIADETLRRHVLAMKIWLPDGTVVFSTDKTIEGQRFDPEELIGPMQGKIGAYLDDLGAEENEHERGFEGPIYEVYIPLRSLDSGKIIAVGEFYENASALKDQLFESFTSSLAVLGGVAVLLWIGISTAVIHGVRTIETQRSEVGRLSQSNGQLERQYETLTQDVENAQRNLNEIDRLFRRRVGLELHDGPSQLLAYVLMNLDEIAELEQSAKTDATMGEAKLTERRAQIERIKHATSEALRDIRAISTSLFSLQNEEASAPEPLSQTVAAFEARTGLKLRKSGLELVDAMPDPVRHGLARVVIEALTNSFRHSGASETALIVRRESSGSEKLILTISDNGKGMDSPDAMLEAARAGRLGLLGMRHRIEAMGGSFDVKSLPDQITVIQIEMPVPV